MTDPKPTDPDQPDPTGAVEPVNGAVKRSQGPPVPTDPRDAASAPTGTPPANDADQDDDQADDGDGNAEAARYRRRLRDAETERDQYAAQVETLQRAEVDRIIADLVTWSPAVMWEHGLTLDMVTTPEGTIDADKVQAAVTNAETKLGLQTRVGFSLGVGVPDNTAKVGRPDPWKEAFVPPHRKA